MLAAGVEASFSRRAAAEKETEEAAVVIAVKAEKVISKAALAWALTHVVRSGDCVTLLAVFPNEETGKRFWNFKKLTGDCGSSHRDSLPDRINQISESCSQMVLQFNNQVEVKVRIKVVSSTAGNAVAAESSRSDASWVIVDKKLRRELKSCLEDLHCNIVEMKGLRAKVLRLNLQCSNDIQTPFLSAAPSPERDIKELERHRAKHSTPVSSPEEPNTSYSQTTWKDSISSSDTITSPFLVFDQNPLDEAVNRLNYNSLDQYDLDEPLVALNGHGEKLICLTKLQKPTDTNAHKTVLWIPQNHRVTEKNLKPQNVEIKYKFPTSKTLRDKFIQFDKDIKVKKAEINQSHHNDCIVKSSIRNALPLGRTSSVPPPLCSLCQHKAPVFGKPPRQFSFRELEEATDGFSNSNLLAEGGFGVVYKGFLRDGLMVAVKLLKFGGSQGDADFGREVRVLSCAQHRNVVLLIGFCIDGKKRVLVYEYICNRSLDFHLHGEYRIPLDWESRLKIAIGTARGLRYLHEDCRVGCIVHRDMRPNNILLTHDFEPLVADFGLARWYSDCSIGNEERVIGTIGYLAPEYVDGGIINQKADVYAFGLVLLELMTGRKPTELVRYKELRFLSDWFHPQASLETNNPIANIYQLLDPCLVCDHIPNFTYQVQAMGFVASLCLSRDPESRPPISKVLSILEGGDISSCPLAYDSNSAGNRSGRLFGVSSSENSRATKTHSRTLSH